MPQAMPVAPICPVGGPPVLAKTRRAVVEIEGLVDLLDVRHPARDGNVSQVPPALKQVSVWLTRDLIDFTKPLTVRVNGVLRWNNRRVAPSLVTMLEDLYARGDRQRLY